MSFSKRIFLAVFSTISILASALIWGAHHYVEKQNEEAFVSRYSVFSKVLGDTLTRLDTNTEALMLNAAKVIAELDAANGPLPTETLKKLRSELSVTHLFVVDKLGNFIRSTNEDPKLIPNVFSFCPSYKNLYAQPGGIEATPVIHPMPEPKPYKFLYIPSRDQKRLLEVGIRVDFVAQTLSEALKADPSLVSLSLFSPNGQPLGKFKAGDVEFPEEKVSLPMDFPAVVDSAEEVRVYTKVASSHPKCCQCDVSGTSKNGEYYYVLESRVSKKDLLVAQATSRNIFLLLLVINTFLAYAFSRLIARRLVRNIESAVSKVREIKESGNFDGRIHLTGSDEVTFLTNEFDRLLDSLKSSQEKILESDRAVTKMQVAREVAHNIRSPILAVEVIMPFLTAIPDKFKKILRDSVREIKDLSERLDPKVDENLSADFLLPKIRLLEFLEKTVNEKQIECSAQANVKITLDSDKDESDAFIFADPTEFRAVISNIVNNAVESYENGGEVRLSCQSDASECSIVISDSGKGIPNSVIQLLGKKETTFGKKNGKGVGLFHAHRKVASWGGKLTIRSSLERGTSVAIVLPRKLLHGSPRNEEMIAAREPKQHP